MNLRRYVARQSQFDDATKTERIRSIIDGTRSTRRRMLPVMIYYHVFCIREPLTPSANMILGHMETCHSRVARTAGTILQLAKPGDLLTARHLQPEIVESGEDICPALVVSVANT